MLAMSLAIVSISRSVRPNLFSVSVRTFNPVPKRELNCSLPQPVRLEQILFKHELNLFIAPGVKPRNHTGNSDLSLENFEMVEALTACQARGARAMLNWSVRTLAERAKVSDSSIRRIEVGYGVPESVTLDLRVRLQDFFEAKGFVFTWVSEHGPGVAWKRPGRTGEMRRRSGD